jgi:ABC-2 type transport system ATP-binding protein
MAEAEELCDRIAIMIHGKITVCGTPAQVTAAGSKETRIRMRTTGGSLLPGGNIGNAVFVKADGGYVEWNCRDIAPAVTELLKQVQDADDTVEDLRVERPSLEERFLELVEGAENK